MEYLELSRRAFLERGKMPNTPEQPIPLGFENSQKLDFNLKPQSSPSVLKLES